MRRTVLRAVAPLYRHAALSTSAGLNTTYGFVGLGKMGFPMATNLRLKLPRTDSMYIYDINTDATKKMKHDFANVLRPETHAALLVATDLAEVVAKCDTIITMLPEPTHVRSVFGVFLAAASRPADKLFIDSSTIDVETSLSLNKHVQASGAVFVDAPVSGGVVGAKAGTLAFMVGSPGPLFSLVEPVLAHMGSRILHCGSPGSGLIAKLANNYLLAISNIATCEAMNFGLQMGLTPDVLKKVINSSSGKCWSSEVNNPVDNESKAFEGGFGVHLMKKDLGLARRAAEQNGIRLEMAEAADDVYEKVWEKEGAKDFSVVYRWLKQKGL